LIPYLTNFDLCYLFLDYNRILISQNIDDIFGVATQNLNTIIRHANELQNIGENQINIIDSLQILLDESFKRTNKLDQELINIRCSIRKYVVLEI
jgi:hypothetical protein